MDSFVNFNGIDGLPLILIFGLFFKLKVLQSVVANELRSYRREEEAAFFIQI
jgi:hypothetical protein